MTEHLTQEQVEHYCRQRLPGAALLAASDHLDECEECRRRVERAMSGDAAFFDLRTEVFGGAAELSPPHLSSEQTALYVDGRLSGEELQTVADHLTLCDQCSLAVDDLRAFAEQVAPALDDEYHPATAPAPAERWWRSALALLPAPFRRTPALAFGTAFALLLIAATGWVIWNTFKGQEPQEAIVSPPPAPAPAPAPSPSPQPEPSRVVAQLNDGGSRVTLDQEGKLSGAEQLPPAYQDRLKSALADPRLERSSRLKGLVRPPSSLMSGESGKGDFSVIEPVGVVVMTDRPVFSWSRMEGATGYVVEVYDSQFNLVVASPRLTNRSWAASQALPRGNVYSWQVKATRDGQEFEAPSPPAPQARFRVLDRAKANELAKAKLSYASNHLTLGLLYAEAGLLSEAEQELRALEKANPDSEIARKLLAEVRALRRRRG